MMETAKDPVSGVEFTKTRINHRFVSSTTRTKYFNDKANALRHRLANIEKPLRKNLLIIEEIMKGKHEAIFHTEFLAGKSYSLPLFTHYKNYDGKNYPAIYNYVLVVLENQQIKFIKYD